LLYGFDGRLVSVAGGRCTEGNSSSWFGISASQLFRRCSVSPIGGGFNLLIAGLADFGPHGSIAPSFKQWGGGSGDALYQLGHSNQYPFLGLWFDFDLDELASDEASEQCD
jgi:hypothetical protein